MSSFILSGNELLVFGINNYGQLGLGDTKNRNNSVSLMEDPEIKSISCKDHSMILKNNGELWVFGNNNYGQLGLGDTKNRTEPVLLMTDPEIKLIDCNGEHSMILKNSGELFIFGDNSYCKLGLDNDEDNIIIPTLLMKDKNIKSIHSGENHFLILKNNGEVWVFGSNQNGQLGFSNFFNEIGKPKLLMTDPKIKLICCGLYCTMIYKNNGELIGIGDNNYGELCIKTVGVSGNIYEPVLLMTDLEIKSIACGYNHSMILKNNGELYVYGSNFFGQLGLEDTKEKNELKLLMKDPEIKSIYCDAWYSMILKNNGDLFVFGDNSHNQLGICFSKCKLKQDEWGKYLYLDKPTLLMNDKNISIINTGTRQINWTHQQHKYFSLEFQQRIHTFLLFLKRNQMKTGLKIPKFVLFEIIKYVI